MMIDQQQPAPASRDTKTMTAGWIASRVALVGVGAAVALGVMQWQAQQAKLQQLALTLEAMQQSQADLVARNAGLEMTSVAPIAPQPEVAAAAQPMPQTQASTASEISNLVTASLQIPNTAQVTDAERIETLAIIQAGVQELVNAVVAGDYAVHTNYEDEYFSGRIHFAFVSNEGDQTALEQFIAQAAERGILAHSSSVLDGEGKVNGHILLFDLVERALENGTIEEQAAGQKMREVAQALLAAELEEQEDLAQLDTQGDRYYTVESGDSLAWISLQFYGDTRSYRVIYDANRDKLSSPERINVGQRLLIPDV